MNISWLPPQKAKLPSPPVTRIIEPRTFQKFAGFTHPMYEKEELFDKFTYIEGEKQYILNYVNSLGLKLEMLSHNLDDFDGVMNYLSRRYEEDVAREISSFDLYRFVEYGYGLLLKDQQDRVMGTIFELFYHSPVPSSFTIRLSVDESLQGYNLGYMLMKYSCLLSMEKGAIVKRAIIKIDNSVSLHINLNKIGWFGEDFLPNIPQLGPFLKLVLPLSPFGLESNSISLNRLTAFMEQNRKGIDYQKIPFMDSESLHRLYKETDFVIVAFIPPGRIEEKGSYLAVPKESLF